MQFLLTTIILSKKRRVHMHALTVANNSASTKDTTSALRYPAGVRLALLGAGCAIEDRELVVVDVARRLGIGR